MTEVLPIARLAALEEGVPFAARADDVDLVVLRSEGAITVFQGLCPHRGTRLADFERRKKLQDEVVKSLERFGAGDRLRRDDLHYRDALR